MMCRTNASIVVQRLAEWGLSPDHCENDGNDSTYITIGEYTIVVPDQYNVYITVIRNYEFGEMIVVAKDTNPSIIARTMFSFLKVNVA